MPGGLTKKLMHSSTIFINIVQSELKERASRIPPSVEQFNISRDFIRVVHKSKDIKSIKYKWGTVCDLILGKSIPDLGSQLKATLAVVTTWRNCSGTHYDDEHGANIVGESAAAVFEEFVSRRVSFVLLILYTIV